MLPCAYKAVFGIDCPVCGFQRALIELMKGNFLKSFVIYPPLLPVLGLLSIVVIYLVNKNYIRPAVIRVYSVIVLVLILINYIEKLIAGSI